MCKRQRPWSLILLKSGDSRADQDALRTIESMLDNYLTAETKDFFLGLSILYQDNQSAQQEQYESKMAQPALFKMQEKYARKTYQNLHALLLAHNSTKLQSSITSQLPRPYLNRYFQEKNIKST